MHIPFLSPRHVITRRDDAALPHENVQVMHATAPNCDPLPQQNDYDDGVDGNSSPNGGE